jgi:hypothetical protein
LRALHRGLLLRQLRGELLRILNGASTFLRQVLVAHRLLLCKHECGVGLVQLRLARADLGLLDSQLRDRPPDGAGRAGRERAGGAHAAPAPAGGRRLNASGAITHAGGAVPLPDGRLVTVGRAEFDAMLGQRRKRAWVIIRKQDTMPVQR